MDDITTADLAAIGDVAARLAEQSDSLSAQQAIELLGAAQLAAKALSIAMGLLEAQALKTLEQPIIVGGTAWAKKPTYKDRPDQTLIARVVTEKAAQPDANGEVPTAVDAAEAATKMMQALYVSPSTKPKVGGVTALGLRMEDVCAEEFVGHHLKQTELT